MHVLAVGAIVSRGGELQRALSSLKFEQAFHQSLPKRTLSDDNPPLVILEASGDDFTRRSRVAVHQYCHRKSAECAFGLGREGLVVAGASPHRYNRPAFHK